MKALFGRKDKLKGTVPNEFLEDAQIIKTREYTTNVVKYMEKMVRTATPSNAQTMNSTNQQQKSVVGPQDELQRLSKTCEGSMHFFYEQRYYYVLKTTSDVCNQLSKRQKQTIQDIYDRAMMPIKVWAEEDYPRFIGDLQKCSKLKKESDAALVSKPSPAKEVKANGTKEQYDQQFRICCGEVEKMRKIRKHHTNCLKLMATVQHKYSKCVLEEIDKAQNLLVRQLTILDETEELLKLKVPIDKRNSQCIISSA